MHLRWVRFIVLLLGMVAEARCDEWVIGGQTRQGTFLRYEDGKFIFLTEKGETREASSRVSRLVLPKPASVTYQTTEDRRSRSGELRGYDRRGFVLADGGREMTLPLLKMKRLEVADVTGGAGEGRSGVELGDDRYPVPNIDLRKFQGDTLTEEQHAAVERFHRAKKAFDAFVDESSRLVAEMEKSTGERRQRLLDQLRLRKLQEQPLRDALIRAYRDLAQIIGSPALREDVANSASGATGRSVQPER